MMRRLVEASTSGNDADLVSARLYNPTCGCPDPGPTSRRAYRRGLRGRAGRACRYFSHPQLVTADLCAAGRWSSGTWG